MRSKKDIQKKKEGENYVIKNNWIVLFEHQNTNIACDVSISL